jgi:hypothetical protein
MIAPTSPEIHPQQTEHEGDDGWLQSWEQELLAENELIAQVAATSLSGQENGRPSGSGQGKKKKKKITLMSTTARRAA